MEIKVGDKIYLDQGQDQFPSLSTVREIESVENAEGRDVYYEFSPYERLTQARLAEKMLTRDQAIIHFCEVSWNKFTALFEGDK